VTEGSRTRRQFLRRAGATLAAGAGVALVPARGARASANPALAAGAFLDHPPRLGLSFHPDICGVACTVAGCPGGCPKGRNLFHCVGCGYSYYLCERRACGSYCNCPGCC
jgi:hypothetical protein